MSRIKAFKFEKGNKVASVTVAATTAVKTAVASHAAGIAVADFDGRLAICTALGSVLTACDGVRGAFKAWVEANSDHIGGLRYSAALRYGKVGQAKDAKKALEALRRKDAAQKRASMAKMARNLLAVGAAEGAAKAAKAKPKSQAATAAGQGAAGNAGDTADDDAAAKPKTPSEVAADAIEAVANMKPDLKRQTAVAMAHTADVKLLNGATDVKDVIDWLTDTTEANRSKVLNALVAMAPEAVQAPAPRTRKRATTSKRRGRAAQPAPSVTVS